MACAGRSLKPVVADLAARGRLGSQRIDDVNEVEFPAQFADEIGVPITARFPAHEKLPAFRALEELPEPGDVLVVGAKTRRTLEEHEKHAKRLGDRERFVPRPADGRVEAEVTAVFPVARVDPCPPVGRARGGMGEDLPRFHGELEAGRGGVAPARGGGHARQIVEAGVDFDAAERVEVLALRRREPAAADPRPDRFCLHDRRC